MCRHSSNQQRSHGGNSRESCHVNSRAGNRVELLWPRSEADSIHSRGEGIRAREPGKPVWKSFNKNESPRMKEYRHEKNTENTPATLQINYTDVHLPVCDGFLPRQAASPDFVPAIRRNQHFPISPLSLRIDVRHSESRQFSGRVERSSRGPHPQERT